MPGEIMEQLGAQALELSKNAVVVSLRFMASACARLHPLPIANATFATDGMYLRYDPAWAAGVYAQETEALARDYLHAVLHNVFLHPFVGEQVDAACWDTACDIVVEHTITELNLSSTRCAREARQSAVCAQIAARVKHFTAEEVYRLCNEKLRRDDFIAAIERASLMAREGKNNLLRLSLTDSEMTITANAERGNALEKIPAEYSEQEFKIAFNARYLYDVIRNVYTEEMCMRFNSSVSPCTIAPLEGNQFTYLVLPVRVLD